MSISYLARSANLPEGLYISICYMAIYLLKITNFSILLSYLPSLYGTPAGVIHCRLWAEVKTEKVIDRIPEICFATFCDINSTIIQVRTRSGVFYRAALPSTRCLLDISLSTGTYFEKYD